MKRYSSTAFTLIELLTVIAIIGILAAIMIPTVGAVRNSAKKSKTKVQFSQWIQAIEMFKQEYGYYPDFEFSPTARKLSTENDAVTFVRTLTGKEPDGTAVANTVGEGGVVTESIAKKVKGNRKLLSFYSFSPTELIKDGSNYYIEDAFKNREFVIIIDRNGDGIVNPSSTDEGLVSVGSPAFTPTVGDGKDIPTGGVRASVIIYSQGKGGGSSKDAVMSWK